tara:strand:- start:149 stop:502 length:354 start_codon:yes stop_codon:yes gene_type:complete
MDLISGEVLYFGAIGTLALIGWDTFQNSKPIIKAEIQQARGSYHLIDKKRKGIYLTDPNHARDSNLRIKSRRFLFPLLSIIVGTYLIYEVCRAILDNSNDDDMDGGMMMPATEGGQV